MAAGHALPHTGSAKHLQVSALHFYSIPDLYIGKRFPKKLLDPQIRQIQSTDLKDLHRCRDPGIDLHEHWMSVRIIFEIQIRIAR
jgi:hypothetical protein